MPDVKLQDMKLQWCCHFKELYCTFVRRMRCGSACWSSAQLWQSRVV